ncbi:MAG: histidinol dehydrogenase [Actinomycetota bacterium]|nr:histidinol dehydrogenase [Actinomycetota bacterium]
MTRLLEPDGADPDGAEPATTLTVQAARYHRGSMLLDLLDLREIDEAHLPEALPRPVWDEEVPTEAVAAIVAEVRRGGDEAVRALTARFDGVQIGALRVPPEIVANARSAVPAELRAALELAYRRISAYHRHQKTSDGVVDVDGVRVHHLVRAVQRAGVYAPGGRARYPSSVIMGAVPAQVAGVDQVVLCVPPGLDGSIAVETLAAAAVCGIDEVYRIGGAQAVAAMAFGTESVPAVDVIVGPGNRYVAEAKRQVSGQVGIPSGFAGPSEVVVVADASVPAQWAAVDVMVQAEHGPDGLAWLVTWDEQVAREVSEAVDRLVERSPRRRDLQATLGRSGYCVLVADAHAAMAVANAVAPEHLELQVADPQSLLPLVRRAGAVFLGRLAPASVGDYLAGPNHVLPTARTARFASALRVDDFCTHIHAVEIDHQALTDLGPSVVTLAAAEGLSAHADSVSMRLGDVGLPAGPPALAVEPEVQPLTRLSPGAQSEPT